MPRDDVDELDELELSEPESLESDEPEADELDRRRRLSVGGALRGTGETWKMRVKFVIDISTFESFLRANVNGTIFAPFELIVYQLFSMFNFLQH